MEMKGPGTISICSLASGNHPRAAVCPETSLLQREGKTPSPPSLTFCIFMQLLKSMFRFYPERCRVLSGGELQEAGVSKLGLCSQPCRGCAVWPLASWLTSISQFIVFSSLKCCAVGRRAEHCCLSSAVGEREGGRRWLAPE